MDDEARTSLRPATQADLPFLTELASLFGGAQDGSPAIDAWMLPDWDLGFIAQRGDLLLAASWWRPHTGFTGGGWDPTEREIFLAVRHQYEGQGLGSTLMDTLIAAAREDPAIRWLAARPRTAIGVTMLEKRRFERKDPPYDRKVDPVWALDLAVVAR